MGIITRHNMSMKAGREAMVKRISRTSGSGDVDDYIGRSPNDVQGKLREIRAAIKQVAPDAHETMEYFRTPGFYYPGYDYNGMFVWFGLHNTYIRLLLRPPTIQNHQKELAKYRTTKAAVHFPLDQKLPLPLVKKLVKESLRIMIDGPPQGESKSTTRP